MSTDTSRIHSLAGIDLSRAKRTLPQPVKDAAERTIRLGGTLTSPLRAGPDFLVVGTKRGGTTSLWNALLEHPQVMPMVPAAKNLKSSDYFFRHYDRGDAWYTGHFPTRSARAAHTRRHGQAVSGEASPMYLFDPRVAERVARVAPDARIVVLLRDPVARAWSHYRERCKEGTETLGFAEALAAEPARLAGEESRMAADPHYYSRAWDWFSYRRRGEYAEQVARWLELFPREQLLVLPSEQFYADQPSALARVHRHLGIGSTSTRPVSLNGAGHPSGLDSDVAAELRAHFAPHNEALARVLRTSPWWNASPEDHPVPSEETDR